MRGSQEREHYWCGEQSVGAWQMMEGRRAFYECRLDENGLWELYVMLSARQDGGLLKMVVRVHDAFVSFFSSVQYSLFVALDTPAVHPGSRMDSGSWNFKTGGEIRDNFVSLLPEQLRGFEKVSKEDRERVLCIWCLTKSGLCTHPWMAGAPALWPGRPLEAKDKSACCADTGWHTVADCAHSRWLPQTCVRGSARRWCVWGA